jgi:hypothetical protein
MNDVLLFHNNWLIVERDSKGWLCWERYPLEGSVTPDSTLQAIDRYKLSQEKIVRRLFKVANGRMGYYLMDMVNGEAYYCGLLWDDAVREILNTTKGLKYESST